MASQLNLDRSDPGVDELCAAWKDGGTYKVTLDITQTKSSPSMNSFEVTGVANESEDTDTSEPPQKSIQKVSPPKAGMKGVNVEY